MKYQRQVHRAFYYNDMDARKQIESAVVLHISLTKEHLAYSLKRTLQLRCSICGHHHFLFERIRKGNGWSEYCDYGWFHNFVSMTKGTWFHLFHGVD